MSVKDNEVKRLYRLLRIINDLDLHGNVITRELAKKYDVSTRTVQRDLDLIDTAGFSLRVVDKGVYAFDNGFSLHKSSITPDEESLLRFLSDVVSSLGEPFAQTFKSILSKFYTNDIDTSFYVRFPQKKSRSDYPFVSELDRAVDEFYKVKLKYQKNGESKSRTVCPLKIVYDSGFWYLFSKVDKSDSYRTFRMDNIETVDVLEDLFAVPDNLKAMLEESVNVWFSGDRDKVIVLRVDSVVANYFKEKVYFPIQKTIKDLDDGSILLETKVSDYMEIMPTVFQWIPNIIIESPEELKVLVKSKLLEYKKLIDNR